MKRFLKRYLPLLLSLLSLFAIVGSTYAYLVATDNHIINRFKLANVDTSTHEKTESYNQKEVWFANDNVSSVYIRARVLVSGAEVGATQISYVDSEVKPTGNAINVYYNSGYWVKDGEWFYYKYVLPGKDENATTSPTTAPLIYKVLVSNDVVVEPGASFEVEVYEESVLTSATNYDTPIADMSIVKQTFGNS